MQDTGRQRKSFVGYEYREIIAESSQVSFLLDGYECFGWEPDGGLTENGGKKNPSYPKKTAIHLKRNRKIINKMELTRLQRNFEACVKEIEALEKSKTSVATIYALIVGHVRHSIYGGFGVCSDGAAALYRFVHHSCSTCVYRLDCSLFSL